MPQLNGGGGDDLGANDELISFKDEGEQEEKTSEHVSAERDLDDVKSSLVNESENNSSSSDSEVSLLVDWPIEALCTTFLFQKKSSEVSLCVFFLVVLPACVSRRRGGPIPDRTRKVMRDRESILLKVGPTFAPQIVYFLTFFQHFFKQKNPPSVSSALPKC